MDGAMVMDLETTARHAPSHIMEAAERCLGGRMLWRGSVRGLFGLIDRKLEIESTGESQDGVLHFRERMSFDDGAVEERHWRITAKDGALLLEADDVELLAPGAMRDGKLAFVYRLKLGGVKVLYDDEFECSSTGLVHNRGVVTFWGAPIMKVTVSGARI